MNFKKDLSIGQKYEFWFAKNNLGLYNTNNDKFYDIITKEGKKYEVKCDFMCFLYYRFGFEISSWKGLSGINTTTSDYWVTIIPIINKIVIIPVHVIKHIIKKYNDKAIYRKTGDKQASKMILWDYNYFMNILKTYDDVEIIDSKIPNYFGSDKLEKQINKLLEYQKRDEYKTRCEDIDIFNYYNKLSKTIEKICSISMSSEKC